MTYKFADNAIMRWLRVGLATPTQEVSALALYGALEMYYFNNGLYDLITQAAFDNGYWIEGLKPLRNPANRVVEFYVARIWPGALPDALPIVAENKALEDPIHKIWEWSNWSVKKQLAARWFSMFGDWFCKVATRNDAEGNIERVYLKSIKPELVTDFETDERGFLTRIRLDIPLTRRDDEGQLRPYTHTEVWEKASLSYRLWIHDKPAGEALARLGAPRDTIPFSAWGIDFVPFTHAKFKDVGEDRGMGAFTHALDKVDEANRQATRLAQMLYRYNKPLFAVGAGGMDPTGRPLPAPVIGLENRDNPQANGTITLGDDVFIYLPGNASINPLVAPVNYRDALAVLQDHMTELEHDLPELAYYRIREMGDQISGRAVRYMLSDAIDKTLEARGNIESALVRANQMALTIAASAGLDGFTALGGTFDEGAFEHQFSDRDVIPLSDLEKAELIAAEKAAGIPLAVALKRRGWTESEIADVEKAAEAAQKKALDFATAQSAASGNPPPGQNGQNGNQPAGQPAGNGRPTGR